MISTFERLARAIAAVPGWREKGWPAVCHPLGNDDFVCGSPDGKG